MIHSERTSVLKNIASGRGNYVLYWMQASQRAFCNHALEYAIEESNRRGKPLLVYFGLTPDYPGANLRHYDFMLRGLAETAESLCERGIRFILSLCEPSRGALSLSKQACLLVMDRGYTGIQKKWSSQVVAGAKCPVVMVESDVVVPVETVSPKEEYAARTIRKKIMEKLPYFLEIPELKNPVVSSVGMEFPVEAEFEAINLTGGASVEDILNKLNSDKSVEPSAFYRGGRTECMKKLHNFVDRQLAFYHRDRNDPNLDGVSCMSPYLHFGQISPVEILYEVYKSGQQQSEGGLAFIEELVVRRELSMNFVHYNDDYDNFNNLQEWCRKTLLEHSGDRRKYVYSQEELESASTHDPYWNAAQFEMVKTGKMHGYMRMYWGKKIIEWMESPEEAYKTAVYLNDKYELDGRDPNGYAGVAWCFGKHDRPWTTREIFGTIRYMNDSGLKRKFHADGYVKKISAL
ncbi:MAG: deoxyribodipyrimidine photo-lyase [Firmicutes bacterium]|nr:deoxyribodipyrimidine photo-lyase [Bacillota bacterium]